jgi:hypothetical protein
MGEAKSLTTWFNKSGAVKWASRPRYTERHFQPYVKAVGQVLLAWNDLHERLATLFVSAMGGGWVNRPLAVWHATRHDFAKRQLLRAAIADMPEKERAGRTTLAQEITWVLDVADKLEGLRDDSAHTPLRHSGINLFQVKNIFDLPNIFALIVAPDTAFQNPRALRFDKKNKNILVEYRYARERIVILRDYVIAMDYAWSHAHLPWPDRPSLPERRPSRRSKGRAAQRTK